MHKQQTWHKYLKLKEIYLQQLKLKQVTPSTWKNKYKVAPRLPSFSVRLLLLCPLKTRSQKKQNTQLPNTF